MKRTTYIMIGMLVTGVAMVCGLMFYVVDRNEHEIGRAHV